MTPVTKICVFNVFFKNVQNYLLQTKKQTS